MDRPGDRIIQTQGEGTLVIAKRFGDLQPRAYLATLINFADGPPLIFYSRIDDLLQKYEGRRILLEIREVDEPSSLILSEVTEYIRPIWGDFTAEEESHGC